MRADRPGTAAILDESTELVSRTGYGWAALLALTMLPLRFLEVLFADRLLETGKAAGEYGNTFRTLSLYVTLAFVLSIAGKAIFVRALGLALHGEGGTKRQALRIAPAAVASFLYASLVIEILLLLFSFTIVGIPVVAILSGLAAATFEKNDRPSLTRPFQLIGQHTRPIGPLVAIAFTFALAFLLAMINLFAAFGIGIWLAGAVPGVDVTTWTARLSLGNRLYVLLLAAGASVLVEPFWLAANVVFVRRVGSRENGEDLRQWFSQIRDDERAA